MGRTTYTGDWRHAFDLDLVVISVGDETPAVAVQRSIETVCARRPLEWSEWFLWSPILPIRIFFI